MSMKHGWAAVLLAVAMGGLGCENRPSSVPAGASDVNVDADNDGVPDRVEVRQQEEQERQRQEQQATKQDKDVDVNIQTPIGDVKVQKHNDRGAKDGTDVNVDVDADR